jgi:hypothetical protein
MAARIQYCHWFHHFVCEGVHVQQLGLLFKWNMLPFIGGLTNYSFSHIITWNG